MIMTTTISINVIATIPQLIASTLISYFSVETVVLEATDSGASTAPDLSRHISQDMSVAYSSSNVIIKNMICVE